MKLFLSLVCLLFLLPVRVFAACESVFLPDLNGPENVQVFGAIPTSFTVPPLAANADGFYPFTVQTTPDGTVIVTQTVGDPSKHVRTWTNITRVSLVSWMHTMRYVMPEHQAEIIAYLTLPNQAPTGVAPTWAYRILMWFDAAVTANLALSTPLNLGEIYNVGVFNRSPYVVGINLQVLMQLCH